MKLSTKRWWYIPPNKNDWFFVHIRETFQSIFKCKHDWYYKEQVVHGEPHGLDCYRRYCKVCDEEQYLAYHRFGRIRTEWKVFPRF